MYSCSTSVASVEVVYEGVIAIVSPYDEILIFLREHLINVYDNSL
jgi:hypothetical protein